VEVQLDALFTSALDWVMGQLYAPRGFTPKESPRHPQVKTLWGSTSSVDAVEKTKISWPATNKS